MKPSLLETLSNLFMFVLWFRIWTWDDRGLIFNRYLLPLGRLADKVAAFLTPIFFGASERIILAVTLGFFVCFRAAFISPGAPWQIEIGPETYMANANSVLSCILFSALSFAMLLFRLSGLSLIYIGHGPGRGHPREAAYCLTRPFSDVKHARRPFVLLAAGVVIVLLCRVTSPGATAPVGAMRLLLRAVVVVLAEWVNLLPVVSSLLFMMIIGSWIGAFMGGGIAAICREWLDLLIGPLRSRPIRLGMIDFTPLILMFVLNYVHIIFYGILLQIYKQL